MRSPAAEVLKITPVFEGRTIRLELHDVRLPNGVERRLEIVRHPGAAAVVPLRPNGQVVLVRQLRHAAGTWLYEVPAGKLSPGEAPEACAHRELAEEVGLRARALELLLAIFPTPGFCDERIWLFLARDLEPVPQALDEDEVLEVATFPLDDALAMIARGEIQDGKTVAALAAAALRLRGERGLTAAL